MCFTLGDYKLVCTELATVARTNRPTLFSKEAHSTVIEKEVTAKHLITN